MSDPVRFEAAADEVFCGLLEAAWREGGLAWSRVEPRPSGALSFEVGASGGDGW